MHTRGHSIISIIVCRAGPLSSGFPCWVGVLGTHLYQCASWWCCERLHSASVNFFEEFFNAFVHFMVGDLQDSPDHTTQGVQQFLTKNVWLPCSTLPIHLIAHWATFFVAVFPGEKRPHREMFCWWGRGETKNGRNTKRHQNQQGQTLFWAVGKTSQWVYCISGEDFEGAWSWNT